MADKPLTTSPMYPGVEYVRVRQGGAEFTTAKTSVTKDMTVLKDADAVSAVTGLPLEPTATSGSTSGTTKKATAKRAAKKSARKAASSTSSSGTTAASTRPEEG